MICRLVQFQQNLVHASGAKTSTLSITNNESSDTAYYKVEYKLMVAHTQLTATNLSIAANLLTLLLTASVAHGSTITWRIKDSLLQITLLVSAETQSTSDAVDCDPCFIFSSSFASCANGAKIPLYNN